MTRWTSAWRCVQALAFAAALTACQTAPAPAPITDAAAASRPGAARIEALPYFDKTFPPHWRS